MKRPAILVTAVILLGGCASSATPSVGTGAFATASPPPGGSGSVAPSIPSSAPPTVLGAVGTPAQHPYGTAANGLLLYDRAGDIYSADPKGTGETALITGPTTDDGASWSRDGEKFVFVRAVSPDHVQLMVADADGSHVRILTGQPLQGPDWGDWSPDGTRFAVHHTIDGRGSISILADDGRGSIRTLALDNVEPSGFVDWRPPAGQELIFVGRPHGTPTDLGLNAVHPDGSGLRQVAIKHHESGDQISYQDPVLTADGSRAVFWNWEPGVVADRCCSVHVVDLTTGEDRRMTYGPTDRAEIRPVVSPDGSKIVFESGSGGSPSQLMVAPLDGSAPGTVIGPTFAYNDEHSFDLSPDGSTIVLYMTGKKTHLIDLLTGATTDLSQGMSDPPNWQRRSK